MPSDRTDRRIGLPTARRVVPALLSAVILGILGMHVLSQHCAMLAHEDLGHASAPATTAHAEHPAGPVAAAAATFTVVATMGDAGGSAHLALMLCASIVLATAIALLLLTLRGRTHLPSYDVRRSRRVVPRLARSPGGTGPPAVWRFSVIRC